MNRTVDRVPAPLWLWAAPLAILSQLVLNAFGDPVYRRWVRGETGLVENATLVFLVGGLMCTLRCWRQRARVRWRGFGPAALVFAAGLLFFAGEEASWGQHWLGFHPPAAIAARNDQGEFNLHNDPVFEKVFDHLPRAILTVAALVGGVIAPLVRRRGGTGERDFHTAGPSGWMWPTLASFPAAFFALTVKLPEHVFAARDRPVPYLIDIVPGETKELCLALFLFVYALGMQRALASEDSSPCGSESEPDHLLP
jgi:hypothetical protein